MPQAGFWQQVMADGLRVPDGHPLDDLTTELVIMLGSRDPALRDGIAYPALATWISRGVYDDLLSGLGDGMVSGLAIGLGESGSPTVFRRSFSALVVAECIERDSVVRRMPAAKILDWGDRIAAWFIRERDLRGYVVGEGWAHAVAHGADAIGALSDSPHLGKPELTVMLDVLADRLLLPSGSLFGAGEPDRLASATMRILRRNVVPLSVLEPWIARLSQAAIYRPHTDVDPFLSTGNAEAFLRALYLQLSLAPRHPDVRADLLLTLVQALKASNPHYLTELS
jgi:hypothetical protein